MSVQTQIGRIETNIANAYTALSEMGAIMPDKQNSENLAATARTLPGGGEDLEAVLTEQEALIAELQDTLRIKAAGSGEVVEPVIEPLTVRENGTYTAPEGVDGYSPVVVEVPIPDGYIVPSGTKEISENGIHDVTQYASVVVNVPSKEPLLQEKTVTENGEVTPDDGYDGLSKVTVNVPTGGGGGGSEINTGTCTIKITVPSSSNYYSAYEQVKSGAIDYKIDRNYTSGTLTKTVRCDSLMYIQGSTVKGATLSDGELLKLVSGYGIAYRTPSTAGVTVQITLTA